MSHCVPKAWDGRDVLGWKHREQRLTSVHPNQESALLMNEISHSYSTPISRDLSPLFPEFELAAAAQVKALCDREGPPQPMPENPYTNLAGVSWLQ